MESLQASGTLLQYIVCAGLGVYGGLLAIGKVRLESGLTLQPAARRRSILSGVFLVAGQVICALLLLSERSPVSPFVLVVGTFAFSMLSGWIIDKALPRAVT